VNVTCDVIEQPQEICLEPTLKFLLAFIYDVFVFIELHKC